MKFEISVVLCTLNEELNIFRVLSNLLDMRVNEIILVDGGSSDRTIDIANELLQNTNSKIITMDRVGTLKQRIKGILESSNEFILFADADDEFLENAVVQNLDYLIDHDFDGVQFSFAIDDRTWVSKIWSKMLSSNHHFGQHLKMLGRPSIVKKEIYKGLHQVEFSGFVLNEDSYLNEIYHNNKRFIVGPGKTFRLGPVSLKEMLTKIINYGKSDAQYSKKTKKFLKTTFHLIIRYPVIFSLRSIFRLDFSSFFLNVFMGYLRFISMIYHYFWGRE